MVCSEAFAHHATWRISVDDDIRATVCREEERTHEQHCQKQLRENIEDLHFCSSETNMKLLPLEFDEHEMEGKKKKTKTMTKTIKKKISTCLQTMFATWRTSYPFAQSAKYMFSSKRCAYLAACRWLNFEPFMARIYTRWRSIKSAYATNIFYGINQESLALFNLFI